MKWIIFILLLLMPTFVGSNTLPKEYAITLPVKKVVKEPLHDYYTLLGKAESNNDYQVVNQYGYMGKYQFGKSTLRALRRKGVLKISNEQIRNFTTYPELQERAVRALTQDNMRVLHRYGLQQYIGRRIGGVEITMTGMLAGAHLLGARAVNQFVKSNGRIIKKDGNGTTIIDYLRKFA